MSIDIRIAFGAVLLDILTDRRAFSQKEASMAEQKVRVIPLGGVDEFGKNITVVEYGDDMLVVDCGSIFPKEDMLGVDLVIPDVTYLIKNRSRIRGMLLTHGHEDHIGATPYVLRQVPPCTAPS